jgi:hypothetical protein
MPAPSIENESILTGAILEDCTAHVKWNPKLLSQAAQADRDTGRRFPEPDRRECPAGAARRRLKARRRTISLRSQMPRREARRGLS